MGDSWKSLPDVAPAAMPASWKSLPDVAGTLPVQPLQPYDFEGKNQQVVDLTREPEGPAALSPRSISGTVLRHFGKGASLGFSDELSGLSEAGNEVVGRLYGSPPGLVEHPGEPILKSAMARYRSGRDDARRELAAGEDENPVTAAVSDLAGGLAVPIPGGGGKVGGAILKRALPAAGKALLYGTVAGAGGSDADLTKGELGRFIGDVSTSALTSGVLGGAGGVLSGKGGQVVAKAEEDARAAAQKVADKAFNSARGALGGETSAAFRTLEQAERAIADPAIDPMVKTKALAFLQSPEGVALRNQVVEAGVDRGSGQLGRISSAQQALMDAAAGKAPGAVDAAAAARTSLPQAMRAVGSRALHVAQKVVPPVVGGIVGQKFFGSPIMGAAVGGITSAVMGAPGRTLANMVRDPAVRTAAGSAAQKVGNVAAHVGPRVAEEELDRARLEAWLKALRGG